MLDASALQKTYQLSVRVYHSDRPDAVLLHHRLCGVESRQGLNKKTRDHWAHDRLHARGRPVLTWQRFQILERQNSVEPPAHRNRETCLAMKRKNIVDKSRNAQSWLKRDWR